MKYGRFVILNASHSIVKRIQSNMVVFRDLRYFLLANEIESIDEANNVFVKRNQNELKIIDYDIIGWALKVDGILQKLQDKSKSTQSQSSALLWVQKSRIGGENLGRISRTFLELAMFVRLDTGDWKKKTRYTTSNKGIEPFATSKWSENLQKVILKHYKNPDIDTGFLVPDGLLEDITQKEADTGEHLDRDSLIQLQLLTETGEFTELTRTLVDVVERWWLVEILISHPDDLNHIAPRIPLEGLLYAIGESSNSLCTEEISNFAQFDIDNLTNEIMRVLSHYREISVKLSDDESEVVSTFSNSGLIRCDSKTLIQRIADTPLWVQLEPVDFEGRILKREVSLLTLRLDVIEKIMRKILSEKVNSLLIEAPAGWGKTGSILRIAVSLERSSIPIALYQGGTSRVRIPKETVIFVDDVHRLSLSSLNFLANMKEEGYQIVMTLSQEYELPFTEKLARLKREGIMFDYITVRLPRLEQEDTMLLIKDRFPSLSSDDYERLLRKVAPLNNSPEAVAFLSMQWELIKRGSISQLNTSFYSIFKTPPLLLDILLRGSSSNLEVDSELAALIIINKLGGEILSAHEKHISKLAKQISKSVKLPRYYKSFLESISLPDSSRIVLNQGIKQFLNLSESSEMFHSLATELYRNDSISKFNLESAKDLFDSIERISNQCEMVVEKFLNQVLAKQKKIKKIELLPYVILLGKTEITSTFIEKHYGWLKKAKRSDLLENLVSPLLLGSVLEKLAEIVDYSPFAQLDESTLLIFEIFRNLWKKKVAMPQDEFNASYLEFLSAVARKRMQSGEYQDAFSLIDEGINLAAKVRHLMSQDRLLCEKIQLLRSLSPVFCPTIKRIVSQALDVVQSIETVDTRPLEAIVRNQEALAMLHCGDVETSVVAAKLAENLLLDYNKNPPDVHRFSPLELVKSLAWSQIEQGLCKFEKQDLHEARFYLKLASGNLLDTRHMIEITQIIGYEPVIYLREGKIAEADELVAKISTMGLPIGTWFFSSSYVAYYYFLFETANLDRIEEAEKFRQAQREFYPYDDNPTYLRWFDFLRRIIYHRKNQEYDDAHNLANEFLEWLINDNDSRYFVLIEYIRAILSFVLREIGICYFEQEEYRNASKLFLGSLVYWMPIFGSRSYHADDLLRECLQKQPEKSTTFSGWNYSLDNKEFDSCTQSIDEETSLKDYEDNFWVGISELVRIRNAE